MNQSRHVAQPALCDECLSKAHTIAEFGPAEDRVLKLCNCRGEGNAVIAVASKSNGRIAHWHVEGPMSFAQASIVGQKIIETLTRAGLQVHEIRPQ